jgi:hypothetical protein
LAIHLDRDVNERGLLLGERRRGGSGGKHGWWSGRSGPRRGEGERVCVFARGPPRMSN